MRTRVLGGLGLLLALAGVPTTAEAFTLTADCNANPSGALGSALAAAVPFDVIEVSGTCTETIDIRTDNLVIQGVGASPTVAGQLYVTSARQVTVQDLKVQGDGTSGTNGIVSIDGAAITVANSIIDGVGDHGVIALHNSSATLDHVQIRNANQGVAVEDSSSLVVTNGSLIENNDVGIVIDRASSAIVVEQTTIQNNTSVGIGMLRGGSLTLSNSIIKGSPEGVSLDIDSNAMIDGSTISTSNSAESSALTVLRGSTARLNGGNTLKSSTFALSVTQGAMFIQHNRGHDKIVGPVEVAALSIAEFRNVDITGSVNVSDHSLVRMRDTSDSPANVSVRGNLSVSQDSGLNFLKPDPGDQRVKVVGNITCADTESSISAPSSNVTITGKTSSCTGYNQVSN